MEVGVIPVLNIQLLSLIKPFKQVTNFTSNYSTSFSVTPNVVILFSSSVCFSFQAGFGTFVLGLVLFSLNFSCFFLMLYTLYVYASVQNKYLCNRYLDKQKKIQILNMCCYIFLFSSCSFIDFTRPEILHPPKNHIVDSCINSMLLFV